MLKSSFLLVLFSCAEVTLCGWQDVDTQLINCVVFSDIGCVMVGVLVPDELCIYFLMLFLWNQLPVSVCQLF